MLPAISPSIYLPKGEERQTPSILTREWLKQTNIQFTACTNCSHNSMLRGQLTALRSTDGNFIFLPPLFTIANVCASFHKYHILMRFAVQFKNIKMLSYIIINCTLSLLLVFYSKQNISQNYLGNGSTYLTYKNINEDYISS